MIAVFMGSEKGKQFDDRPARDEHAQEAPADPRASRVLALPVTWRGSVATVGDFVIGHGSGFFRCHFAGLEFGQGVHHLRRCQAHGRGHHGHGGRWVSGRDG